MDFLQQIGYAGLNSRIKRLSDELLYSTRDYYKNAGLNIEPNWHLIFLLLEKHNSLTITEISQELRMSHPACVKIINKMKKKNYIETKTDKNDSRKQLLELSEKSKNKLPNLHKHWDACIETTKELIENSPNFMQELTEFEKLVADKNYNERTIENVKEL
ncbi:MarR family winged helix-turn-helix transcriptional regulator [Galbibacter pacificus]|uniref:MarR family winged helix-turn-helix transcriptional regulator n=1 Tax=Galbibacter pacificus TaxID=2996052 RepID=A0ABT6FNX9_9FLAO|nr:MarR family winged helix-turn-helix transcriptional regulator [Galbibacter pacificus]MDG3581442.1 MarR family winged helix-turn-helix transcriptional regulator [Galbibacter pacificus]MDG3584920.1 MarR family winged helix-turn-helix transcriptional regulator [Galbibacter pacificus]